MSAIRLALVMALARSIVGCSGDVTVHGVPESIQLQTPFCVPSPAKDAATDASSVDAADGGDE
jgi:hypothetical protein